MNYTSLFKAALNHYREIFERQSSCHDEPGEVDHTACYYIDQALGACQSEEKLVGALIQSLPTDQLEPIVWEMLERVAGEKDIVKNRDGSVSVFESGLEFNLSKGGRLDCPRCIYRVKDSLLAIVALQSAQERMEGGES